MRLSESSFQEIVKAITEALKAFRTPTDMPLVTDIHLLPIRESGELVISDDDHELSRTIISDLSEIPENEFDKSMEDGLRAALHNIDRREPLESLAIWKPFSFLMVDDDGQVTAELMLFDDDQALVTQTLMSGLDEELDSFLKELLEK